MPKAVDVKPVRWSNTIVLFDNGYYSAMWGHYDDSANRRLGVRWSGEDGDDKGYPISRGRPVWYIEPDFLVLPVLKNLLEQLVREYATGSLSEGLFFDYKANIITAIQEHTVNQTN